MVRFERYGDWAKARSALSSIRQSVKSRWVKFLRTPVSAPNKNLISDSLIHSWGLNLTGWGGVDNDNCSRQNRWSFFLGGNWPPLPPEIKPRKPATRRDVGVGGEGWRRGIRGVVGACERKKCHGPDKFSTLSCGNLLGLIGTEASRKGLRERSRVRRLGKLWVVLVNNGSRVCN